MVSLFNIIILLVLTGFLSAQIPNNSFEYWTNGEPNGWTTSNFPPNYIDIEQSNDAYEGNSSVLITSDTQYPFYSYLKTEFPYTERPAWLIGYYKLSGDLFDNLLDIWVLLLDEYGYVVGEGWGGGDPSSEWNQYPCLMRYWNSAVPTSCSIEIRFYHYSAFSEDSALVDYLYFSETNDIKMLDHNLPNHFELKQNYPNPFNPLTNIEFSIPQSSEVKLVVYNQLGQTVATVVNERLPAGSYSVDWNAADRPSGVYFYRIKAGEFSKTRKFILSK